MADLAMDRGGNVNRILARSHASDGVDAHQLNITYFSALGLDGIGTLPRGRSSSSHGAYRSSTTSGCLPANDQAAVATSGEGRSINRHDYTRGEVDAALQQPVVRRLLDLIRLRNTHPAFDGTMRVTSDERSIRMAWTNGPSGATLEV